MLISQGKLGRHYCIRRDRPYLVVVCILDSNLSFRSVWQMDVKTIGIYGWVPYVGAMLGAWFGGLLAQNRIKAGWNVDKTRKTGNHPWMFDYVAYPIGYVKPWEGQSQLYY